MLVSLPFSLLLSTSLALVFWPANNIPGKQVSREGGDAIKEMPKPDAKSKERRMQVGGTMDDGTFRGRQIVLSLYRPYPTGPNLRPLKLDNFTRNWIFQPSRDSVNVDEILFNRSIADRWRNLCHKVTSSHACREENTIPRGKVQWRCSVLLIALWQKVLKHQGRRLRLKAFIFSFILVGHSLLPWPFKSAVLLHHIT